MSSGNGPKPFWGRLLNWCNQLVESSTKAPELDDKTSPRLQIDLSGLETVDFIVAVNGNYNSFDIRSTKYLDTLSYLAEELKKKGYSCSVYIGTPQITVNTEGCNPYKIAEYVATQLEISGFNVRRLYT